MEDTANSIAANPGIMDAVARIKPQQLLVMLFGLSLMIAMLVAAWMWSQSVEYKVLYSNLSDRDGGAIIESLQQQNIPYKFAEGGGALLVPGDKVHEIRLRLASQGLPKGGTAGFELMENQKFGTSQFLEQVNYQRSLEGELSRSIQTLGAVLSARVHLAIPKPTVFVKEQQKPSASVVLTLYPGRALDPGQVLAIAHLISSSIPNMPSANVTVIDQQGTLLSSVRDPSEALDATQLKYVRQIEQDHIKRIEDILVPLIALTNMRVQVSADVDFTSSEQTAESYKPNQQANQSTIRSTQTSESKNAANANPVGVPGALSNQPPVPATAPIVIPATAVAGNSTENTSSLKEATTNFEVDRTISHTKLPVGNIKRLSVAVLINNRTITDSKGKAISKPYTPAELAQLNNLIKNAMGFNQQRGDSLNLLNSAFNEIPEVVVPELPLWKQPDMIAMAKDILKYLLLGIAAYYFYTAIVRPPIRRYLARQREIDIAAAELAAERAKKKIKEFEAKTSEVSYETSVEEAKKIAQSSPKIVATVIQEWMTK